MILEIYNTQTGEKKVSSKHTWDNHYSKKFKNGSEIWKVIREIDSLETYNNELRGIQTPQPIQEVEKIVNDVFEFESNRITLDQILVKLQEQIPANVLYNESENSYTITLAKPEITEITNVTNYEPDHPYSMDFDMLKIWLNNQGIATAPNVKKLETLQKLIPEIYTNTQK
jgi:hypothetical protein